jgi:quercetin 2,3-dioxygenase
MTQTEELTRLTARSATLVVDSLRTLEGGGFPVRRPFPKAGMLQVDPFLLLDHLGPVQWGPGEGVGAPDHPHRGFETVTYLLSGEMQHRDSAGHHGDLRAGDVQWMTAGAGVVHSELPTADFMRTGGVMHGFQLWVNLPAAEKMIPPRYQDIPAAHIPEAISRNGRVKARVIAGSAMGQSAVIETRTPIMYLHYTLQPGGTATQAIPADYNAFLYVIRGIVHVGEDRRPVREGQLALLGDLRARRSPGQPPPPGAGTVDDATFGVHAAADLPADVLLLGGLPLNEPVARHGPFVMNTEQQILEAIRDFQEGRMGAIAP